LAVEDHSTQLTSEPLRFFGTGRVSEPLCGMAAKIASVSESSRIADQLRRSYEGPAWHGPSLREALEGVTPDIAAHRCSADVHSIWELVVHLSTWAAAARRFVGQNFYVSLTGVDDWPEPTGNWSDTLENLARAQRELWDEVGKLPDARLEDVLSVQKQYTVYILLHGVAQHNLYHAGQISLLKKLVVQ
jgi:hypothetical protein